MNEGQRLQAAYVAAFLGLYLGSGASAQTGSLPDEIEALVRSGRSFQKHHESRMGDSSFRDFPRTYFSTRPSPEDLARAATPAHVVIAGATQPLHARISAILAAGNETSLADFAHQIEQAVREHESIDDTLSVAMIDFARLDENIIRVNVSQPRVVDAKIVGATTRLRSYLNALVSRMRAAETLSERDLERYLLLLNRTPGCKSQIAVSPGSADEAALTVHIDCDRASASAKLSNLASPGIGREILSSKLVVNDIVAPVDFADLRIFNSFAPGDAVFFDGSYGMVAGTDGLIVEIGAFYNDIRPDQNRTSGIDVKISNTFLSAKVLQPVFLRKDSQVFVGAGVAHAQSTIWIGGAPVLDEERLLLQAEAKWAFKALGAANSVALFVNQGIDVFGATERGDALTPRGGDGAGFTYLVLEFEREHDLTNWARLVIEAYAQASTRALFVPDQCTYGGRDFGRAFDLNALFGDSCILALSELQLRPSFFRSDRFSLEPYLYADGGALHQVGAANPSQPRNAARVSAGGGVRLVAKNGFSARFEFTQALRRNDAVGDGDERGFFFEIAQDF